MKENQKTVNEWGDLHYPGETVEQKFLYLLEEVVELGVTLGVPKTPMLDVVEISHEKSKADFGRSELAPDEAGDSLICLEMLAHRLNFSLEDARDAKMKKNRRRTPEESAARREKKRKLGIG